MNEETRRAVGQVLTQLSFAISAESPNGAAAFLRTAQSWMNEAVKRAEAETIICLCRDFAHPACPIHK